MNQRRENLNMLQWRLRAAAFLLGLAAPLLGWAQNTIQAITSSQQAGSEVVRIELSEPLAAAPTGFTVQVEDVEKWDRLPIARRELAKEFRDLSDSELNVSGFHVVLRHAGQPGGIVSGVGEAGT